MSPAIRAVFTGCCLLMLLSALALVSMSLGGSAVGWAQLRDLWQGQGTDFARIVVLELRLPRLILGLACGSALALAGCILRVVARNPLADPTLTGVSAGAALFVVAANVLWPSIPAIVHPLLGMAGGALAAGIAMLLAWQGQFSPLRLALCGLSLGTFCTGLTTALLVIAGPQAGPLFFWLAGGLMGRGWLHVSQLWPWLLPVLLLLPVLPRMLDLLQLPDDAAASLGVNLPLWRVLLTALAVWLTAAVVSVAGPVGFVGLLAPILARAGHDIRHLRILPLAMLYGAVLVTGADMLARTLAAPRELPLGFLTAILAAPWLLAHVRRVGGRT